MSAVVLALIVGMGGDAQPLAVHTEAQVSGPTIYLGDLVDLSPLPPALLARASDIPVAHLRSAEQTLSSREVFLRARAAVPLLTAWLPDGADQPVHVRVVGDVIPATVAARPNAARAQGPAIQTGDKLSVRAQIGPVRVERDVIALQPGRTGHRMFVRTADGAVLSVLVGAIQ